MPRPQKFFKLKGLQKKSPFYQPQQLWPDIVRPLFVAITLKQHAFRFVKEVGDPHKYMEQKNKLILVL